MLCVSRKVAIKKYHKHPSITSFSFQPTEFESIIQEICVLDISKAAPKDSIPPKIIKDNRDIFYSSYLGHQ